MKRAVLVLLAACGGAQQQPTHELPPQPSASAQPAVDAGPPAVSVVKYDDLGISFGVPADFRVIGDAELEARIRSSGNVQLQSELRKHAAEKKAMPLLVLQREGLYVTLSVVVVPKDASALEVMAGQQAAIAQNTQGFQATSGPEAITLDGASGATLSGHYEDHGHPVACTLRLYVRPRGDAALATLAFAVFQTGNTTPADAAHVLDGLHFYAP